MTLDDPLTQRIIGSAIEVHRSLGPGLLESIYEECLCVELNAANIRYRRQVPLPVTYKGIALDCSFRVDVVVEEQVIVEVKSVENLLPIHQAQLLTYMKLSGIGRGLVLNFHTAVLKDGIRRMTLAREP
jgi:GxxExxY protein